MFPESLIAVEMKKIKVKIDKPILSILDLIKTVMCKFWHDYVKPKYGEKAKLCYMDTDSFIINSKTEDFYKDIAEDVETRFGTSNYEVQERTKNVIGLMKDELGGKIITRFVALRPKTYSYLMDNDNTDKKAKSRKKCVIQIT